MPSRSFLLSQRHSSTRNQASANYSPNIVSKPTISAPHLSTTRSGTCGSKTLGHNEYRGSIFTSTNTSQTPPSLVRMRSWWRLEIWRPPSAAKFRNTSKSCSCTTCSAYNLFSRSTSHESTTRGHGSSNGSQGYCSDRYPRDCEYTAFNATHHQSHP